MADGYFVQLTGGPFTVQEELQKEDPNDVVVQRLFLRRCALQSARYRHLTTTTLHTKSSSTHEHLALRHVY